MFYDRDGTYMNQETFLKYKSSFELKNLKKLEAQKMGLWDWYKMPDEVKHHRVGKDNLIKLPVGIRSVWQDKFEDRYGDCKRIEHPPLINPYGEEEDLELSEKQNISVASLLEKNVGFGHFSTATGKTYMMAKIIDKLKVKTLIVCSGLELTSQMKDDMETFFGVKCRTITGSKTKQKGAYEDIVIGNIDSLVKLSFDFLQQFDLVLLDEADTYLSAENRINFIFNLPMKYQYGLTGTIEVNHTDPKIFSIYFGKKTELIIKHFTPDIHRVQTEFFHRMRGVDKFNIEFSELKSELYGSSDRNKLIVNTIEKTLNGRKGIVFCERVEHSEILCSMLEERGIKTFMLIGEIKKNDRIRIKKELKEFRGPCVLVGNRRIIGRGFSVPELSVGYFVIAEKFKSNIEQFVGRIIRLFPGKERCDWYDFIDVRTKILAGQAKLRATDYKKYFPGVKIGFYN